MAETSQFPNSFPTAAAPYNALALYVGDLAPDVSETQLYDMFSRVGPVTSVRLCRDAATRKSLGYGYVNFLEAHNAEDALNQLNFERIRGRPCRLMRSQRDPSVRKSQKNNLFIKGLGENYDSKKLYDVMSGYGNILSVKVPYKDTGSQELKSCGYGFVQFSEDSAAETVAALKVLTDNTVVTIEPYRPRGPVDPSKLTNVYVKNLPLGLSDEALRAIVEVYGSTKSILMPKDEEKQSKGYAYVDFTSPGFALECISKINGLVLPGSAEDAAPLYAAHYKSHSVIVRERKQNRQPARQYPQGCNLYVKNLADDVDEEVLKAEFSKYGNITSCIVRRDPKLKVSLGFGFVCFEAPEFAQAALDGFGRGYIFHTKPLFVAVAQTKAQRTEFLRLSHQSQNFYYANAQNPGMYPGAIPGLYGQFPRPFPYQPPFAQQPGPVAAPGQLRPIPAYAAGSYNQPFPPGTRSPSFQGQPRPQGSRQAPAGGQGQFPNNQRYGSRAPGQQQGYAGSQYPQGQGAPQQNFQQGAQGQQQQQQRRPPAQQQAAPAQQPVQAAPAQQARAPLNAQLLANMLPEQAKRAIGEAIYPKIASSLEGANKPRSGKITGMLLEALDITELLNLLEDSKALDEKLMEALRVLNEADGATST